jgi:hypothetical protein
MKANGYDVEDKDQLWMALLLIISTVVIGYLVASVWLG